MIAHPIASQTPPEAAVPHAAAEADLESRIKERRAELIDKTGLSEDDLKDRDKLERLEAKVMAEVSRRHGELGQAAAAYKQDIEHGTWNHVRPWQTIANRRSPADSRSSPE